MQSHTLTESAKQTFRKSFHQQFTHEFAHQKKEKNASIDTELQKCNM